MDRSVKSAWYKSDRRKKGISKSLIDLAELIPVQMSKGLVAPLDKVQVVDLAIKYIKHLQAHNSSSYNRNNTAAHITDPSKLTASFCHNSSNGITVTCSQNNNASSNGSAVFPDSRINGNGTKDLNGSNNGNGVVQLKIRTPSSVSPPISCCEYMRLTTEERVKEYKKGFNESIKESIAFIRSSKAGTDPEDFTIKLVNHLLKLLEESEDLKHKSKNKSPDDLCDTSLLKKKRTRDAITQTPAIIPALPLPLPPAVIIDPQRTPHPLTPVLNSAPVLGTVLPRRLDRRNSDIGHSAAMQRPQTSPVRRPALPIVPAPSSPSAPSTGALARLAHKLLPPVSGNGHLPGSVPHCLTGNRPLAITSTTAVSLERLRERSSITSTTTAMSPEKQREVPAVPTTTAKAVTTTVSMLRDVRSDRSGNHLSDNNDNSSSSRQTGTLTKSVSLTQNPTPGSTTTMAGLSALQTLLISKPTAPAAHPIHSHAHIAVAAVTSNESPCLVSHLTTSGVSANCNLLSKSSSFSPPTDAAITGTGVLKDASPEKPLSLEPTLPLASAGVVVRKSPSPQSAHPVPCLKRKSPPLCDLSSPCEESGDLCRSFKKQILQRFDTQSSHCDLPVQTSPVPPAAVVPDSSSSGNSSQNSGPTGHEDEGRPADSSPMRQDSSSSLLSVSESSLGSGNRNVVPGKGNDSLIGSSTADEPISCLKAQLLHKSSTPHQPSATRTPMNSPQQRILHPPSLSNRNYQQYYSGQSAATAGSHSAQQRQLMTRPQSHAQAAPLPFPHSGLDQSHGRCSCSKGPAQQPGQQKQGTAVVGSADAAIALSKVPNSSSASSVPRVNQINANMFHHDAVPVSQSASSFTAAAPPLTHPHHQLQQQQLYDLRAKQLHQQQQMYARAIASQQQLQSQRSSASTGHEVMDRNHKLMTHPPVQYLMSPPQSQQSPSHPHHQTPGTGQPSGITVRRNAVITSSETMSSHSPVGRRPVLTLPLDYCSHSNSQQQQPPAMHSYPTPPSSSSDAMVHAGRQAIAPPPALIQNMSSARDSHMYQYAGYRYVLSPDQQHRQQQAMFERVSPAHSPSHQQQRTIARSASSSSSSASPSASPSMPSVMMMMRQHSDVSTAAVAAGFDARSYRYHPLLRLPDCPSQPSVPTSASTPSSPMSKEQQHQLVLMQRQQQQAAAVYQTQQSKAQFYAATKDHYMHQQQQQHAHHHNLQSGHRLLPGLNAPAGSMSAPTAAAGVVVPAVTSAAAAAALIHLD